VRRWKSIISRGVYSEKRKGWGCFSTDSRKWKYRGVGVLELSKDWGSWRRGHSGGKSELRERGVFIGLSWKEGGAGASV